MCYSLNLTPQVPITTVAQHLVLTKNASCFLPLPPVSHDKKKLYYYLTCHSGGGQNHPFLLGAGKVPAGPTWFQAGGLTFPSPSLSSGWLHPLPDAAAGMPETSWHVMPAQSASAAGCHALPFWAGAKPAPRHPTHYWEIRQRRWEVRQLIVRVKYPSKSLAPKRHLASGSTTMAAKTNKNPIALNLLIMNKLSVISPSPLIHPKFEHFTPPPIECLNNEQTTKLEFQCFFLILKTVCCFLYPL